MHDSPQQEDLRKAGEICQGGLALIIISASPPIDLSPAQVFQGLISSLGGGAAQRNDQARISDTYPVQLSGELIDSYTISTRRIRDN